MKWHICTQTDFDAYSQVPSFLKVSITNKDRTESKDRTDNQRNRNWSVINQRRNFIFFLEWA